MILSEFNSLVSTEMRRGTTLDTVIPQYAKMAALWLERNYPFKYMENFRLLQLIAGDRTVNLPSNRIIKAINFIRLIDEEGTYVKLKRGTADDFKGTLTATPTGFWTSGINTIVFNNTPDENVSGEAIFEEYTDWPTAASGQHPLLDIAVDVMLYQTSIFLAAYLRDAEMVAAYKALRDEGLNTLLRADDETRFDGSALAMAYTPHQSQ